MALNQTLPIPPASLPATSKRPSVGSRQVHHSRPMGTFFRQRAERVAEAAGSCLRSGLPPPFLASLIVCKGACRMTCDIYRITIKGHLDSEWSDWFDGLTITMVDNGETILIGPIVDQTALHGVLIKIRDLGLPLLSLTCTEPDEPNLLMHPEEEERAG